MYRIEIVAVGGVKEPFIREGIEEYTKRIAPFAKLTVVEIKEKDENVGVEKALEEEGKAILKRLEGYVIVLDSRGETPDSESFAKTLFTHGESQKVTLVIGSSNGLCEQVKQRADKLISFGRITYPHQLMRLILAEQIYRACTIKENKKYHK
ncbi:MAG: 23S rRNA (pseudouridine(1915)-N(3))-methyltransferase RlmH [Clostridia bacterium]|nr:23S rRNA (pseudouridine(1915)-N(3))-methyltransferase RlmH [Clostridia bacterium]